MHRCNKLCNNGFHYHESSDTSYEEQLSEEIRRAKGTIEKLSKLGGTKLVDGQPRPDNYNVLQFREVYPYIALWLNYPNCTNYKGDKILVIEADVAQLVRTKHIDPHFSSERSTVPNALPPPIARFEPTERGWEMALFFIQGLKDRRGK